MKNKYINSTLQLFIISVCILLLFFENFDDIFLLNVRFFLVETVFIFIILKVFFNKTYGKTSLVFLFLIMNFIFIYMRIYLSFLFAKNFGETTWYYPMDVSYKTQKFTLDLLICNLLGIILGLDFLYKKKINFVRSCLNKNKEEFYFKITSLGFYLSYPFCYLKMIYQYKIFLEFGYAAANYTNKFDNIPILIRALSQLNLICFIILIATGIEKKKIKILILYILTVIPSVIFGGRALIISTFLFCMWYIDKILNKKIKLKVYIGIFFILLLFSLLIIFNRNQNIELINSLWIQGETVAQLHYLGEFFEQSLEKYGRVLRIEPFIYIFRGYPIYKGLSPFYPIYELSAFREVEGAGIGGNYIVDMYVIGGKFGVIILSALVIFWLAFIEKYLIENKNISLIKSLIFQSIILFTFNMPRQGLFYFFNISQMIYILIVYGLIYILFYIVKNGGGERNTNSINNGRR